VQRVQAQDSTATRRFVVARRTCTRQPGGPTVDSIIDEFLRAAAEGQVRDRGARRLTPDAILGVRWFLAGHVSEALGQMKLADVRQRHVQQLICDLSDAGLAPRRLHAVTESIRTLYDYAIERRLVRANPAERVAPMVEDHPVDGQMATSDRVISFVLGVATTGFGLVAVVLTTSSL
jgi:hypothetical protein